MFDIGADELLLTAVVAIVVIGPKDLPRALRTAGRWIAKMRRMSNAFRAGIENVIREAEMEELERTWREQNAAIMAQHPHISPDADQDAAAAAAAAHGQAPAPAAAPLAPVEALRPPVMGELPAESGPAESGSEELAPVGPVPTAPPPADH